jgi:GTP-binding protein YchF
MSVDIGIIGLEKSGRTTVFNALTGADADTGSFSNRSLAPHVGIAKVPDKRLEVLAGIFHPRKVVFAETKYIDIGASVKSLAENKGISGQLLTRLNQVDELLLVVRAFKEESVPHPEGSVDTARDIATMQLELAFSDLIILERRLERIAASLKGAKTQERQKAEREQSLLRRIKQELENNVPLREMEFSPEEERIISGYQFLTAKPLLVVVNIGEKDITRAGEITAGLSAGAGKNSNVAVICGKLEMELSQLGSDEAASLRAEYGINESGLDTTIRNSYALLGLISFLTVGADEVRAWPIREDTVALRAAGKIHSDIERGFIRAEVIGYRELVDCGSLTEAKKRGQLRLEGKEYVVRDGDVINYLFNV